MTASVDRQTPRADCPDAAELRRLLVDAREVCRQLGLAEGARPQTHGLLICCPWHEDRRPSCSIRIAPDGTLGVHCFSCDAGGDVLDLVAVAHGLDVRRDFPLVLRRAAELAGSHAANHSGGRRKPSRDREPAKSWPPVSEVQGLWSACLRVGDDAEVAAWLRSRAVDPAGVEDLDLARALPLGHELPRWACFRGKSWTQGGFRCLVPMFDTAGDLRGLRARRVVGVEDPKSVAPASHTVRGLVMADGLGRTILSRGRRPDLWPTNAPLRIIVVEGEPDHLSWATGFADSDATAPAVIGIVAGCWTADLASRVPDGSRVIIRTDHDEAGERYAREICDSLINRCTVLRGGADGCPLCVKFGWTGGVR